MLQVTKLIINLLKLIETKCEHFACTQKRKNYLVGKKIKISQEGLAKLPENAIPADLPKMVEPSIAEVPVFDGPMYNDQQADDDETTSDSGDEEIDLVAKPVESSDAFARCMVPIPIVQKKEKE